MSAWTWHSRALSLTILGASAGLGAGACSHLDEVNRVNPAQSQGEASCSVELRAPGAGTVFLPSDDLDKDQAGLQIELDVRLSGSDCETLRWGPCDQPAHQETRGVDDSERQQLLPVTLSEGEQELCVEVEDSKKRVQEARVSVSQLVCEDGQSLCGDEPICYDLQTDPLRCGDCDNACPGETHGKGACSAGVCSIQCDDGYHYDPAQSGIAAECTARRGCAGLDPCSGQDCCAWDEVAETNHGAIRFQRGWDASDNGSELGEEWQPRNEAAKVTVQAFHLDRFEVTVGRFRRFVAEYDAWIQGGVQPRNGYAQHPALPQSGWQSAWNKLSLPDAVLSATVPVVPSSGADFAARVSKCGFHTYTDQPGANEARPINCINFFEAFLFCMWDQGRLPTEAEWNAAAASGAQRMYPWSMPASSSVISAAHALYGKGEQLPDEVGAHPTGAGPFRSQDLSGNVYEWVRDSEVADPKCMSAGTCSYGGDASDPIELTADVDAQGQQLRVLRGGSYKSREARVRTAHRYLIFGMSRISDIGMRCARPMVPN
jgi:sulfatase modifying factor 1